MSSRRTFLGAVGVSALAGCADLEDHLASFLVPEPDRTFSPPTGTAIDHTTHLIQRLTYGPRPGDYQRVLAMGADRFIEEQLTPTGIDDRRCAWRVAEIESLQGIRAEHYEIHPRRMLFDMTRARIIRATQSKRQLEESMVEFWTDHFNISSFKGDCRWVRFADERDVVRPHALGRFGDLLRASATSPAMLVYLDGAENVVRGSEDKPNENYARELLELHTLGVNGGYSQRDVMEAARCLSGWTYGHGTFLKSLVEFKSHRHDDGAKEVLGMAIPAGGGAEDLDRLLEIVSTHPSTAHHISEKLCRWFITDAPSPETVATVAAAFSASDGDIRDTLRALIATPEFDSSRGTLLKRPFRLAVSAMRGLGARTEGGWPIQRALERMGHAPYQYPTPDGFPIEPGPWTGTLLWRWNFVIELAQQKVGGTRWNRSEFEDLDRTARHLLGRAPSESEQTALASVSNPIALLLASPAFQWH